MIILSYILMAIGIVFFVVIVREALRFWKENKGTEKMTPKMAIAEFVVYFLCAMGFPDFVMNTLVITKGEWVEVKRLPPTLYATAVVPSMMIGANYLRTGSISDIKTFISCMVVMAIGCFLGARASVTINEKLLKRVIGIALIGCMIALIIKLILQNEAVGTATALTNKQLLFVLPVIFILGFLNMLGIPMKPATTAMFLICGLTPLATLSLILSMVSFGALSGIIKVVHDKRYHRGITFAGSTFGLVGALLGLLVTININAFVLTIILLIIMGFASYTMLKPKKA